MCMNMRLALEPRPIAAKATRFDEQAFGSDIARDEWPDDCGGDVRKAEIRIFDKVGVRTVGVVGVTLSDARDDRRNGA